MSYAAKSAAWNSHPGWKKVSIGSGAVIDGKLFERSRFFMGGVLLVGSKDHHQMVWSEFLGSKRTLCTEKRDYEKWHKGRLHYAVWTIGIPGGSVRSRFNQAKRHLAGFLLGPYRRQPHVTLFVCGFLAKVERFDDDYTVEGLTGHLRELEKAKIEPFEIGIGGINSFAAAPFLEVFDVDGGIHRIRHVLSSTHSEIRGTEYLPHLTLGLYSNPFETAVVAERISSFGAAPPLTHLVDKISLSAYSASEIAGPLAARYEVVLSTK